MARKRRRSRPPHAEQPYRCDRPERITRNRSALLEIIKGFYAAALDRLPVAEMPALVPRLLKAGLCVGFSDPVSNIIINTSTYRKRAPDSRLLPDGDKEKAAKRKRRRALSRAVADTGNANAHANDWPLGRRRLLNMPVATRSLEALVAFLTFYFRYLPACEALEYLYLARADLLAAVQLVEEDRAAVGLVEEDHNSNDGFNYASHTARTALRCAALAARHPKPRALVNRSCSLVSQMDQVSRLLAMEGGILSCTTIQKISMLIKHRKKLQIACQWKAFCVTRSALPKLDFPKKEGTDPDIAGVMPPQFLQVRNKQLPFVSSKSVKSVLRDLIYGLYLDVLALLPSQDLQMCYHQSLLKAGHCYGPMVDPMHNIMLNTLWYKNMYPPKGDISVVTMICSRSLVRVACRSLYGLVAFFCARFPMISKKQAIRYLLLSKASLWIAVEMARRDGYAERNVSSQKGAYKAAATAALHPDPDAVAAFFLSTFPMIPIPTELHMLDVQRLSELLFEYCSSRYGSPRTVPVLSERASKVLSCIMEDFKDEESFARRKVNAMLKNYTLKSKGPEYDLHVICGLNSNVGDSYVFGLHYGPGLFRQRRKEQYSHINFLASPKGSLSVPILFFAECSNDENAFPESSCWLVMGRPGRCFHCENEGAKIIHPNTEMYRGCHTELKEMACSNLIGMAVEGSITDGESVIDSVDICEEDCIYFDASRDVKCAEFLNARAMSGRLV